MVACGPADAGVTRPEAAAGPAGTPNQHPSPPPRGPVDRLGEGDAAMPPRTAGRFLALVAVLLTLATAGCTSGRRSGRPPWPRAPPEASISRSRRPSRASPRRRRAGPTAERRGHRRVDRQHPAPQRGQGPARARPERHRLYASEGTTLPAFRDKARDNIRASCRTPPLFLPLPSPPSPLPPPTQCCAWSRCPSTRALSGSTASATSSSRHVLGLALLAAGCATAGGDGPASC